MELTPFEKLQEIALTKHLDKHEQIIKYKTRGLYAIDMNVHLRIKKGEANQPKTIPIRYIEFKREGVAALYYY